MDNFEYIKGYENLYKINRNGEIYSCWYKKIMKHLKTDDGYYFINLKKEGIRKKGYIHRLLALQYIENPKIIYLFDKLHLSHYESVRLKKNMYFKII